MDFGEENNVTWMTKKTMQLYIFPKVYCNFAIWSKKMAVPARTWFWILFF